VIDPGGLLLLSHIVSSKHVDSFNTEVDGFVPALRVYTLRFGTSKPTIAG
jgi:hypothetical protein